MFPELQYPDFYLTVPEDCNSLWAGLNLVLPNYYNPVQVKKRRNSWFTRINDELKYNVDGSIATDKRCYFVTCTYRDECVPIGVDVETGETTLSLDSRGICLFLKRLKWHFKQKDLPIRYFKAEEYGDEGTLRPHIHLILFTTAEFFVVQELVNRSWSYEVTKEEFERLSNSNVGLKSDDRRYVHIWQYNSGRFGNRKRYFASMGFSFTEIPRNGERTSQYIAKYVAKLPDDLKSNYLPCKRPRPSSSRGLGLGYCRNSANREYHRFSMIPLRGNLLDNFRRWLPRYSHTGVKEFLYSLPRRYKLELYSERDRFYISKFFKAIQVPELSPYERFNREMRDIKNLKRASWSFI